MKARAKGADASEKSSGRKPRPPVAPLGLRLAFAAINEETSVAGWAGERAAYGYAGAQRVLRAAGESFGDQSFVTNEAKRLAVEMWGRKEAEVMLGESAFSLGFATCWLVMTGMNGGAR